MYEMAKIPRLHKALFCSSLETGTRVIGWLALACSSSLILASVAVILLQEKLELWYDQDPQMTRRVYQNISLVLKVVVVVMVCRLITDCLLLVGTYKKRTSLMIPWLWLNSAGSLIGIVIAPFLVYPALSAQNDLKITFVHFIIQSFFGISFYCFLNVFSFFRELKEQKQIFFRRCYLIPQDVIKK